MRRGLAVCLVGLGAACFQPWSVSGPYRCGEGACPDQMVCDDGVCCHPDRAPVCRALVLDGGTCFSGASPRTYFEDLDGDGYGNPKSSRTYCAQPVSDPFVDNDGDCDDAAAEANPLGQERCDGLDNDCDGTVDEGMQPQKTFYRDQDGDGAGDPSRTFVACAAPPGYSESANDCAPTEFTRHPGADELCNGLDDDCDLQVDEQVVDVGVDCADAGLGECFAGRTTCQGGAPVCAPAKPPSSDLCDGKDNDCDGTVDERPSCGGPASLLGPGVVTGAQNLGRAVPPADLVGGCLKDYPGSSGETWSAPTWAGGSSNHHLWYIEAPGSETWDLSKQGTALDVHFTWSMIGGNAPNVWDSALQPVVHLCGQAGGGYSRYVHTPYSLLDGGTRVHAQMPVAGGNGWVLGVGAPLDLTQVKRVEVLVKPRYNGATSPAFTIVWQRDAGFLSP